MREPDLTGPRVRPAGWLSASIVHQSVSIRSSMLRLRSISAAISALPGPHPTVSAAPGR
jgi:hypothetical protein